MLVLFFTLIKFIAAIFTILVIGIVTYYKYIFNFFERCGVPYPTPSIPFGNFANPLYQTKSMGEQCCDYYKEYKSKGQRHVGIFLFAKPIYVPISRTDIKNIMVKDFQYFVDRGVFHNEKDDPLSAHLFSIEGARWRNLRAKLTPTFTTGKMKLMFEILIDCGHQLKSAMNKIASRNEPVNITDYLARYSIDVIGSCAFGLTCNSFEQPDSDFRTYGGRVLRVTRFEQLRNFATFCSPDLGRKLSLTIIPSDAAKFFLNVIKQTVDYREINNVERKDFIQLLMNLKNVASLEEGNENYVHDGKSLTFEELAAQAFIFFLAGFDTTSTVLSFCFFELALNQEIQERVRQEIMRIVGSDGTMTYDSLVKLVYTGQVIEETLRKYAPNSTLHRICAKDYCLPESNVTIKQGTSVFIPVRGLHLDPEYFPNPEAFDPSRFSAENRHKIKPFTYIPFGDGPRNCIGKKEKSVTCTQNVWRMDFIKCSSMKGNRRFEGIRFALMQMKIALIIMLTNYKFSLNSKTKLPLVFNPYSFIVTTMDDIWLDVSKVKNEVNTEDGNYCQ